MKRIGFYGKIKPHMLEEYKKRHREVWPEMLEALRETGWQNYSLFLREDGLLFGYVEVEDFDKSLSEMAKREVNARWQAEMAPFFEIPEGRRPDESIILMEEVFHLD